MFTVSSRSPIREETEEEKLTIFEREFGTKNDLDGCYHVFLDIGSNRGVQPRKLFEPGSQNIIPIEFKNSW